MDLSLFWVAFTGGLVSFVSPCNAALLPTFLAYLGAHAQNWKKSLALAINFAIGYAITFAIVGVVLTTVINLWETQSALNLISGVIILVLAIYLLFIDKFSSSPNVDISKFTNQNIQEDIETEETNNTKKAAWGAFLLGFSLGSAFIPCVTPVYASILSLSLDESYSIALYITLVYAIGLTVPFLLLSIVFSKVNNHFIRKLVKYGIYVQRVFALFLLWIGIEIILTGLGKPGLLTVI